MSETTPGKPGTFSWIDLATTDTDGAGAFYGKLFGWTTDARPMGDDQYYTIFKLGDQQTAAMYELMADQRSQGIPPHWNSYVLVTSADDSAAKAKSLGANILMEPFDVYEHGRMAVVQDPTGAIFCLWQARDHPGAGVLYKPGALGWNELLTNDTGKAKEFYTKLFGWEAKPMPMGEHDYTVFMLGEQYAGGMMAIQAEWGPVPPNWMVYIVTADCDATTATAREAGADIKMEPMDIPNVGRIAVITDPQGATFGIFQMPEKPK